MPMLIRSRGARLRGSNTVPLRVVIFYPAQFVSTVNKDAFPQGASICSGICRFHDVVRRIARVSFLVMYAAFLVVVNRSQSKIPFIQQVSHFPQHLSLGVRYGFLRCPLIRIHDGRRF